MTEKLNDFELYEIDGETYSLNEIRGFIESSKKVERQTRFINALKLNLSKTTQERNQLCDKANRLNKELQDIKQMSMWEFADKYCSDSQMEADARLFAKELLHSRVTGEYKDNETAAVIAEEEFIAQGEKHYNDTWNIACGDDF
jgi:uncharacterized protein (DUF2344 family)